MFVSAGALLFGAGCYECNAMGCGNELQVTLENATLAFNATKTPTVLVCADKLCTTFHLDGTDPLKPRCEAAAGSIGDVEFCVFGANGAARFTALGLGEDEIDASIEVRAPDGAVLFTAARTLATEDHSSCGDECYSAATSFTMVLP